MLSYDRIFQNLIMAIVSHNHILTFMHNIIITYATVHIHRDTKPRNCHEHEKAKQYDQTEDKQIRHDATDMGEPELQITESTMKNFNE